MSRQSTRLKGSSSDLDRYKSRVGGDKKYGDADLLA